MTIDLTSRRDVRPDPNLTSPGSRAALCTHDRTMYRLPDPLEVMLDASGMTGGHLVSKMYDYHMCELRGQQHGVQDDYDRELIDVARINSISSSMTEEELAARRAAVVDAAWRGGILASEYLR